MWCACGYNATIPLRACTLIIDRSIVSLWADVGFWKGGAW